RTSWRTTRWEGEVPAVAELEEQVSVREWPARPVLTPSAAMCRATKYDNCKDSYGRQPSEHRVDAFTLCMTTFGGVKFCKKRGSESNATAALREWMVSP